MKGTPIKTLCLTLAALLSVWSASAGETTTTFTPDTTRVLRNPLNGWVLYLGRYWDADFWETRGYDSMPTSTGETVKVSDYAGTAYLRTSWAQLEPLEGVYAWRDSTSRIYRLFKSVRDRGLKLSFRIVVDGRDQGQNTPMYVMDAGARYYTFGNGKHKSPYPDDPVFQKAYSRFIEALAEDFNDPSAVEFIDAYGLGKWGEAHGMVYSDASRKNEVFDWITSLYARTFSRVPLLIHYHRVIGVGDGESYGKVDPDTDSLLVSAINKGYSLRHDAFGMTDYYQQWEKDYAKKWAFRRPIILEGGWITGAHHRYWNDSSHKYRKDHPEDVRLGEFLAGEEAHVNMMDFRVDDQIKSWFTDCFHLVKRFVAEGGYRLYPSTVTVPSKVKRGEPVQILHTWENIGWGYCPNNIPQWNYKYKPAFALLDKSGKAVRVFVDRDAEPSDWIKGKACSYRFPILSSDLPKGRYTWAVALVDTSAGDVPGLLLSLPESQVNSEGWTPAGKVTIR